jgi:hypothetical protein
LTNSADPGLGARHLGVSSIILRAWAPPSPAPCIDNVSRSSPKNVTIVPYFLSPASRNFGREEELAVVFVSKHHGALRSLGGLVLALLSSIAPTPLFSRAHATTFVDVTIEDLARASDLVVVGRVEHVDVLPQGPAGQPGIHTRAIVQVAETLRGEHQTIIEVWVQGGRLGDRMRVIPGQAQFRVGEDVVLFLFRAGDGCWPTGLGRGAWRSIASDPGSFAPTSPLEERGRASRSIAVSIPDLRRRLGSVGYSQ